MRRARSDLLQRRLASGYANYLVQYAKDYAAAGVPLSYLGPQNTKVECCATEGWDYAQQYAAAIEGDASASSYTPLFTSHGYTQAPTTPLSGWNGKAWETEWFHYDNNGWDTAWDDGSGDDGLTWAQHIYDGLTGANLNAFLFWYGTNTRDIGGNGSFLMLNTDGTVSVSSRLWAFANYSRFIRPGATRIGAATSNTIPARSLVTYVIPAGGNNGDTVTVADPGSQRGTAGTATSLQLHATDSAAGQTLTYSATGLPAGLALNATTGLISGTPSTAGTYSVIATVTDTTGAAGSTTFTWTVTPAAGSAAARSPTPPASGPADSSPT